MLNTLDSILNRYTMYRVVLYSLILLLAVAFIFALTGQISISAGGLLVSVGVLIIVSYAANKLMALALKVATSTESWLITALILACILPPPTTLSRSLAIALTGVLAVLSKYILVWKRSPIFNPAAIAAFIVSISGLLPATWWIGSPPMAAFSAIVGLLILRKQKKFSLFISFALASLAIFLLATQLSVGLSFFSNLKTLALSYPLIFMGSVMLTEPSTLPSNRYYQVLYGILVGSVFTSQLHAGRLTSTPQVALIIGNIFALLVTPRFSALMTLKKKTRLADNIYDLAFQYPGNQSLNFISGQYLEWTVPHRKVDSRGNRRTFSIASAPNENELHIGLKSYLPSSSFKQALLALEPGQRIRAAHLSGDFVLPQDESLRLIFIAGGIGITPFRAMVRHLTTVGQKRNIELFYLAGNPAEFVYKSSFEQAAKIGLKVNYVNGRLTSEMLKAALKDDSPSQIYISGPDAMVRNYKKMALALGVPGKRIKTDHFSGY
jgi:ferredoxin-NADP reductase